MIVSPPRIGLWYPFQMAELHDPLTSFGMIFQECPPKINGWFPKKNRSAPFFKASHHFQVPALIFRVGNSLPKPSISRGRPALPSVSLSRVTGGIVEFLRSSGMKSLQFSLVPQWRWLKKTKKTHKKSKNWESIPYSIFNPLLIMDGMYLYKAYRWMV